MDITAFALCEQGAIPIIVFNVEQDGNLTRLLNGEKIGTIVHA
jgi:uridylate kinase